MNVIARLDTGRSLPWTCGNPSHLFPLWCQVGNPIASMPGLHSEHANDRRVYFPDRSSAKDHIAEVMASEAVLESFAFSAYLQSQPGTKIFVRLFLMGQFCGEYSNNTQKTKKQCYAQADGQKAAFLSTPKSLRGCFTYGLFAYICH